MNYAQLDLDHICIGVSQLSGSVGGEVYTETFDPITGETTKELSGYMVEIPVYTSAYIGLKYEDGEWAAL